jgi:zinc finger SWIM domain-containing protein 3
MQAEDGNGNLNEESNNKHEQGNLNVESNNNNGQAASWVPRIGMEFSTTDEAWTFWVSYAGKTGFDARKHYSNKNKDGVVTSTRFLCGKEGHRSKDKREGQYKSSRAKTRTGCKARMGILLDRSTNKYRVHDFEAEHNHILYRADMIHLIPSQRKVCPVDAMDIEAADHAGIAPKAAHVFSGEVVGGTSNLGYTLQDRKNYLRSKRQRSLQYGEAGGLLKYFQEQVVDNPSFQHAIQLDSEEQITNIFWADAKMLIDYALFGDVITFDTTYSTNKEYRPFGVFVGFNHFREIVVFGAALLYDETLDSFRWLFETFLAAHNQKHPKTIFTDQNAAMGRAVGEVFIDTIHGLCCWHMGQNAIKHLSSHKSEGPTEGVLPSDPGEKEDEEPTEGDLPSDSNQKKDEATTILKEYNRCMYLYEKEEKFEEVFKSMRSKVKNGSWLDGIYKLKHKWAYCYMKDVFTLGMRSTQLSESFNKDLKQHLKFNLDIVRFFKHFERAVQEKREKEVKSEHEARKKLPMLKLKGTPVLQQAANVYTPPIFKLFQEEFEKSAAAYIKNSVQNDSINEFTVAICNLEGRPTNTYGYKVSVHPINQTVSCSCKKFEEHGILCSHV